LELGGGYRDQWPADAKQFYAECYALIDSRMPRKTLIERAGRGMKALNTFLENVPVDSACAVEETLKLAVTT
jgi:hypothetical protein